MADKYIGSISGSRGVAGEILVKEVPEGMLALPAGSIVKIGYSASFGQEYIVERWRANKRSSVIKVEGIDSKETAFTLKENGIFADEDLLKFEIEASFAVGDIEGCTVKNIDSGAELGTIKQVMILPANDVWVIAGVGGDIFIPVIDEVVLNVDLDARLVEVKMIDGLLEANMTNDEDSDE